MVDNRQRSGWCCFHAQCLLCGCPLRAHAVDQRDGAAKRAYHSCRALLCNSAHPCAAPDLGQEGQNCLGKVVRSNGTPAANASGFLSNVLTRATCVITKTGTGLGERDSRETLYILD